MKIFLTVLLFLAASTVLADPPMKVIYQKSSTTAFSWQWPYHTVQSSTTVYSYPSPTGSTLKLYPSYATYDDLTYYRFHNPQLTYKREWGYFFPPQTRPVRIGTVSAFQSPQGYFAQPR